MAKKLMKGAEVICESAIAANCKYFYGYPITPQNEVPEYMSKVLPKIGGAFVQAESEVAAINMVYGGAGSGKRVMTSSSSPGIALKQEGISYLAAAELPCVVASISRSGPGLGGILPSQADYFQATRGGGNGDYKCIVLAPSNLQELSDLTQKAFYLSELYRTPSIILADGMLCQMMEPVDIKQGLYKELDNTSWSLEEGTKNRNPHIISSLHLLADELEAHNLHLQAKYQKIKDNEQEAEMYKCDDATVVVVAYGSASRISRNAVDNLREKGIKVGLIRPVTLFPFPENSFNKLGDNVKDLLVTEFSMGQMVEDVKIVNNGKRTVTFYGRTGGNMFSVEQVEEQILKIVEG